MFIVFDSGSLCILIVIGEVRGKKLAIPLTVFVNDVLSRYVAEVLLLFS